jgi:hypothetical protein
MGKFLEEVRKKREKAAKHVTTVREWEGVYIAECTCGWVENFTVIRRAVPGGAEGARTASLLDSLRWYHRRALHAASLHWKKEVGV